MAARRPVERTPIAAEIRRLRLERDLSQRDIVERSGGELSLGHLGMVESGQRLPGADVLDALGSAMGLSADEMAVLHSLRKAARAARRGDMPEPVAGDDVDLGADPDLDEVLRKVQEAMDAMEAFKRAHERKERR